MPTNIRIGLSNRLQAIALSGLLVFSSLAYAQQQQEIDIPFTLMGNSPIIQAYVNNNPKPINMLLDTGAGSLVMVLPDHVIQEFAIPKLEATRIVHNTFSGESITLRKLMINNFRLGDLSLQSLDNVYEDPKIWGFCTHRDCIHDGVIGLEFFRKAGYNLLVDYQNTRLKLIPYGAASNTFRTGSYIQSIDKSSIVSQEKIQQTPVMLFWDTGASDSYLYNAQLLPPENKKTIAYASYASMPIKIGEAITPLDFIIDDSTYNKSKGNCQGVCAYVGYDFFIGHTVFFDLENSRLYVNS